MRKKKKIVTVSPEVQLFKTKIELAQWKRKHKALMQETLLLQDQVECSAGLQEKPVVQKWSRKKVGKSSGVAVIVPATDWHAEERVSFETTGGKNSFNLVEAERRIKQYYQKIIKLLDWQNHLAPVIELWHPLLGDLLSGYIHDELAETNALSPTEACLFLQEMITSGIDLLLRETKLPIFIPTCVGNHSRTTQKMRIKTAYANSYEWLLYSILAKSYEKNSRVQWQVGKGYHNICNIIGRKVRFHHGDSIIYRGGVGGISISVNKAVAAWDLTEQVDLDVFGHYHQFKWDYTKWVACGCLIGYNEFAIRIKAAFQHPTQTFIVIDRDFCVTDAFPIFLTKPGGAK
jgi:hypothetical protein